MPTPEGTEEQQESGAFTDSYDIATNRFKSMIDEHVSSLTITLEEIQETVDHGASQKQPMVWKKETVLTASNFGNAAKLKAILYSNFTSEAVKYGIESKQTSYFSVCIDCW